MSSVVTTSVKKRVFMSASSQILAQIIIAALGVITLKVSTNYLGIDKYGIYATVLAFVSMFALLTDLGLNAINSREIAKRPLEAEDIISHNIGLRLALCCVAIPLIIGLSYVFYPGAVHELRFGIFILGGFLFFDAVRSVGLSYFSASIRGQFSAVINSLQQILITLLVLVVIITDLGYYGIILSFVVANIVSMILTVRLVRKEIRIRPRMNVGKWKSILGLSISLGVIQFINMMYTKLDSLMLSVLKGTTSVGIYGIAYSLIAAFMMLPSFIMTALIPSIATARHDELHAIVQKALEYMAIFACLLVAGSYVVRNEIVVVVSSPAFGSAATPFAILAVASAVAYVNSVFGYASVSLNKHHKIVYISLATLLLNVGLNFVLIPRFSYSGAAAATLVTDTVATVITYFMFRHNTGVRVSVVAAIYRPFIAAIITIVSVGLIRGYLPIYNQLLTLVITSIEVIVIFGVALIVLRGIPEDVKNYVADKVKH